MPCSDPSNISLIVEIVCKRQPHSILDIGVGTGKYGVLFRSYLDGHRQKRAFHARESWQTFIVGVEVFPEYITPVHHYVYDKVILSDIRHAGYLGTDRFDCVFMGDVLEHFDKEEGVKLLADLMTRTDFMLISTPNFESNWNKPMPFGNEHERHKCRWTTQDFASLPWKTKVHEGRLLTVELWR